MDLSRRAVIVAALLLAACVDSPLPTDVPPPRAHAEAEQAASFAVLDLGHLGGDYSQAQAINPLGLIVGSSKPSVGGQDHGFVWAGGRMFDLGVAVPEGHSYANAVNLWGHIVGLRSDGAGNNRAVLWWRGISIDLGTLGSNFHVSTAFSLNDHGQVVGYSDAPSSPTHAFLWQNGVMTDLGAGIAYDINNRGEIVGLSYDASGHSRPTLWRNGQMIDLSTLGGNNGDARAINDRGEIVGITDNEEGLARATLWRNGLPIDLGTLANYEERGEARDINLWGQVVGTSCSRLHCRGFVWQRGVMTELSPLPGRLDSAALGINIWGLIVGASSSSTSGVRAVIWAAQPGATQLP